MIGNLRNNPRLYSRQIVREQHDKEQALVEEGNVADDNQSEDDEETEVDSKAGEK